MKATYKTGGGKLLFEVQEQTPKDIFRAVASIQEVFDNTTCGACGGADVRFVVRNNDGNEFFEIRCLNRDCKARLSLGQNKSGGGLFPKRKDSNDNWISNGGWEIYVPDSSKKSAEKGSW